MRTYKKPMITVDSGLAEGVYAASGASQGTLNVTYYGVWDRWGTNGVGCGQFLDLMSKYVRRKK